VTEPTTENELAAAEALIAVETICAALFEAMPFPAAAAAGVPSDIKRARSGATVIVQKARRSDLASNTLG
jgi:hypothetical protein